MPFHSSKVHVPLKKRLHKLSAHLVLASFLIQTLMPSYAWATEVIRDDSHSHLANFQTGSFQTGIMVRISKIPPLKTQPQSSSPDIERSEAHLMNFSDDESAASSEGSDDELSDVDVRSTDSGVIYLDDHWTPSESPATSSVPSVWDILTAKHSGYVLTREADGSLRIACDPSVDAAQRSQNVMHIQHEEQNVTVDDLGDMAGLVIHHAQHVHFKGTSSMRRLSIGGHSALETTDMTMDRDAVLLVGLADLSYVHAVLSGSVVFREEGHLELHHSTMEQHGKVAGQKGLQIEGENSSWRVGRHKDAALGAEGALKARGVSLANEGWIQAKGSLDWSGAQIVNTGTVTGVGGVILLADQGSQAGHIVSTNGDVMLSTAITMLDASVVESVNNKISYVGDNNKDVVLRGEVKAKSLNVEGRNLTNQADVLATTAHLAISETLTQRKKLDVDHLVLDGKRIIHQGDTRIGELTLSQKVDIDQRSGALCVEKGTLRVSEFKDEEGTITKLPRVTLDQKNVVMKGNVDVAYFAHAQGSEQGQWNIAGNFMIRDGAFRASAVDVKGKLGLGGKWETASLQGQKAAYEFKDGQLNIKLPLAGVHEVTRDEGLSTRAARKAYLWQIFEANKAAIQASGAPKGCHDYYKMLMWLSSSKYLAHNPGYDWIIEEMEKNAGPWEWATDGRKASPEEIAVYQSFSKNHKKDLMQAFYEKHQEHIQNAGSPKGCHDYYKTLAWLTQERFLEKNAGFSWLLKDFIRDGGHWSWAKDGRTASPEEMGALYGFLYQGRHQIGTLRVAAQGSLKALQGMNLHVNRMDNKGKIESLHQDLRWLNPNRFDVGVLEMGNDELVIEVDDDSDLAAYVEQNAAKWLAHKLRLKAPKLHLTRGWHWTYRHEDGSHAPFMMGDEAEAVWRDLPTWESTQQEREERIGFRHYRLPVQLTVDVGEFMNQSLLKVRGKLNIFSEKDLDNSQGKIHGSQVVAKSRVGKIRVGAPVNAGGYWHNRNGAYIAGDQYLELDGEEGIELNYGLVESYGPAVFKSRKQMWINSSKMTVQGNVRFDAASVLIQTNPTVITPRYERKSKTTRCCGFKTGHKEWNEHVGDDHHATGESCSLMFGGDVSIVTEAQNFVMNGGVLMAVNIYNHLGQKCEPNRLMGLQIGGGAQLSFAGQVNLAFENMMMGASKVVAATMQLTGQNAHIDGGAHVRSIGQTRQHAMIDLMEGIWQSLSGTATLKGPQDNPHALLSRQTLEGGVSTAPRLPIAVAASDVGCVRALIKAKRQEMLDDEEELPQSTLEVRIPQDPIGFRMMCDQVLLMQGIHSTLNRLFVQHYVHPHMTSSQSFAKFMEDILGVAQGREVLTLEELKAYGKPALASVLRTITYTDPTTQKAMQETCLVPTLFNIESNPALMAPGASLVTTHGDMSLSVANDLYARGVNLRARDGEAAADIAWMAGRRQKHKGVKVDARDATFAAGEGVEVLEDHEVIRREEHTKKRTMYHEEYRPISNEYVTRNLVMKTKHGHVVFQNVVVEADKMLASAPEGIVKFLAGAHSSHTTTTEKGGNMFWSSVRQTSQTHVVHQPNRLDKVKDITIDANHIFFQEVETAAQEWIQRVKCAKPGCDISKELVRDIHDIQTKKHQGCSALTGALIGLTLNTLMPGFGGTIMATMGRAALVVLAGKATTSLADNRGDLGKVLDDLASDHTFKSVAVSVGTAGASPFLNQALPSTSSAWVHEAGRQTLREGAGALMRGVVWQERPELDQLALNVVAGTLQTTGAKAIGVERQKGLDGTSHKLGHFIVAAGAESVRSLSIRSLKSGDIVTNMIIAGSSAAMAEVLVEAWADVKGACEKVYRENPGIDQSEFIAKVQRETEGSRTAAHLVTSALAGVGMELANPGSGAASLHVASNAAQTALDNNFIPGAIVLASMAWSAYKTWDTARTFGDYWETYMTGGLEAVTAKAAQDGAMRLIFGGAFKVGGALVMKVGGRLYRMCPEGVQVLGEQGYDVVYKAVKKAEGHAFYKKAVQKEKEWFGRACESGSGKGQTTREKLFGTNEVAVSRGDRVRPINGRMPINSEYAGKIYTFDKLPASIKVKHPNIERDYQHGIPFNGSGHPDFSRYTRQKVQIDVTGNTKRDLMLADRAAGFKQRPNGYTWHHHEDGKTMLLVPIDLHDAVKHTGGVAVSKQVLKR